MRAFKKHHPWTGLVVRKEFLGLSGLKSHKSLKVLQQLSERWKKEFWARRVFGTHKCSHKEHEITGFYRTKYSKAVSPNAI